MGGTRFCRPIQPKKKSFIFVIRHYLCVFTSAFRFKCRCVISNVGVHVRKYLPTFEVSSQKIKSVQTLYVSHIQAYFTNTVFLFKTTVRTCLARITHDGILLVYISVSQPLYALYALYAFYIPLMPHQNTSKFLNAPLILNIPIYVNINISRK